MPLFLTGLLAAIKGKLTLIAGGAALSAGVALAMRLGPGLVAKWFGQLMDKPLSLENPEDKELGLALVKWVEKKLPEAGAGKERYQMAAEKIVKMFPAMAAYKDKMAEFIEASVMAMDAEAKKRSQ